VRVLGIDPGITTGYALYDSQAKSYKTLQVDTTRMRMAYETLRAFRPDELAYEDFKHRPNLMKAELHSVKVIAITELYAESHLVPVKAKFLPGYAKKFWTDAKIKQLELWEPGKPHAMDALRVLLCYLDDDPQWFRTVLPSLKPRP